jgi:DNA-sulfur modification-associated
MSTLSKVKIAALTSIPIPPHLNLDVRPDYDALMSEIGRRSVGFDGATLFGCAFIQGGRLQFTTAMSMQKMLDISTHRRAKKGANVKEVLEQSNRPREVAHEKKINEYLIKTACVGEKFILPSFTFNFGTITEDDTPDVTLILLDRGQDGTTTWPAVLLLPKNAKMETTDGAHRRNTIFEMTAHGNKKVGPDEKEMLLDNAVDVKLVFESSLRDSHQDFADCGRSKPISQSQITAYDARDGRNHLATKLATTHPFLQEYVDGSANNVNLSGKSHRVWSLAALKTMVWHITEKHPEANLSDELKVQNVAEFLDELVGAMPQLKALESLRLAKLKEPATESVTGILREHSGGDVALRAIGLFIFARAYVHCLIHSIGFKHMADQLATINWHALNCARDDIPVDDDPNIYHAAVMKHVNPIWRPLIVVKARRYKISSSTMDANNCWDNITNLIYPVPALAAE